MTRASSFNHFFPWRDGHVLAYNAQSGALAVMTAENHATYLKLTSGQDSGEPTPAEQELLKQLEYGRFVGSGPDAELEWLKFCHRRSRFDASSLGLVIAPTMACNMACTYCFEGNKSGRMPSTVVESVITFIEERASGLKDLQVTWYGGEPLLALDVIDDLTQSILDLTKQYGFQCAFSMISNGYLLTRDTTDRLAALKLGNVQVTLDGPSRLHDAKRPLKSGKGSFATILANLAYAVTRIPVSIRINIDKSFTPEVIRELVAELKAAGLEGRASVYIGLLEPATRACANISESCYDTTEFSPVELEYYRLLSEAGFTIAKLPSPILTFCFAQLANSFLVDPDGDLYRCFNFAGDKDRSMGNLRDPLDYRHPEFIRLFQFDPFEDAECRRCGVLPICMGGCPAKRHDRMLPRNQVCDSVKYNLQPMLELIAASRMNQQRAAQASQGAR